MPLTLDKRPVKSPETSSPSRSRGFWGRAVVWASLLFLAANAVLWQVDKDKRSTGVWTGTGSIDLLVDDFKKLEGPPGVALVGSSLMMYPFWTMDRDRYGDIPDIFRHHDSRVLATELEHSGVKNSSVFNFAVFGAMVSDAYIYVNEFMKGDRKPAVLVYGLAPRDFSDADLPTPLATNTFKRLVKLQNFPSYAALYVPGLTEKVDFIMSHVLYFYDKRWRLQQEANKGINQAYKAAGLLPPVQSAKKLDEQARFMLSGTKTERWSASEKEYKRRYQGIGERDLSVQMGFLKRLCSLCRERGIKLVVVNMPLAPDNRKLMPEGFYNKFKHQIATLALNGDARFIDIGDASEFTIGDFWDTAHLEHGGGYKMLKHLVPVLQELSRSHSGSNPKPAR